MEGDLDASDVHSNTFAMQWPPGSRAIHEFPEVDRAGWFDLDTARRKLLAGQVEFVDRLFDLLGDNRNAPSTPGGSRAPRHGSR